MAKYYTPTKLSENIHETPEGFLVCLGVPIGRTGEMLYGEGETPLETDDQGKILITRTAEELFHPDTIASFEGKAFTIKHPEDFVDKDNWSALAKGIIQNVRRGEKDEDGEESLIADVLVTDAFAIGLIRQGIREVSCGYEAAYEQTGEGKGIQKQIIGNHLALVEQGRAGPSYAINDHKPSNLEKKGPRMSKWSEKVKQIFSKAVDEAAAMEEKEKNKDEAPAEGAVSYDELVKICKDLSAKLDSMKPKDEAPVEKKDQPKDEEKKDEPAAKDAEVASSVEERLKALEMAVAKMMEAESAEAMTDEDPEKKDQESKDEESEEMGDEDPEMTGDTVARAEILSPGIRITKDVKSKALKSAYATKEGKTVIESLTGGKTPAFDSADQVSHLFIATSEILKASRGNGLAHSKNSKSFDSFPSSAVSVISAEKMNEINQAFWSRK